MNERFLVGGILLILSSALITLSQEPASSLNQVTSAESKVKNQETLKKKIYQEEDAKWAEEYKNPDGIGAEEFYKKWKERTQKQAEIANKTRNEEDILRFQNYVERTLQFYGGFLMLQSSKEIRDKKIRPGNEQLEEVRIKEEIKLKQEEKSLNSLLEIKTSDSQSATNPQ
jgi:hypothetical protein